MSHPNTIPFSRSSLAVASFLAGVGCAFCWIKISSATDASKIQAPAVTAEDRPVASPVEQPFADLSLTSVALAAYSPSANALPSDAGTDEWSCAASERNRLGRAHRYEDLGAALSQMDSREALDIIAGATNWTDRASLLRGFFKELAQNHDALTTIKLAMQLASQGERDTALATLLDGWTVDSPGSLRRRAREMSIYGPEVELGMGLLDADPPNFDLAISLALQIRSADDQARLLSAIAQKMVFTDPASAVSLGSTLTGNRYVNFVHSTLQSWAQHDPASALAWTTQITDPTIRQTAQESVGVGWAQMDDETISMSYLSTIPSGPARTEFIRMMMQNQQASYSSGEVNAWFARLSDPTDRATARALMEEAPAAISGIGARLDLDNGIVLVSSLIPDSPAARGGIREGDRILAVAQPGEAWLPVSGIDLDGVVAIIRGAPDTAVQLQVASAQLGGFGAPHVVQLTRTSLGSDQ